MKTLKMMLVSGWLMASCGVAAAGDYRPPPPPPTLASLQYAIEALKTTVSSQVTTIAGLQAELASTAAQNIFALGHYVTVDTTDATLNGVKAPNIIFSGANVHIVSGSGTTLDTTGLGNLVIGYDDDGADPADIDAARTGSHNLIVGDNNTFTSGGGLVAGEQNAINGDYASVSGGIGGIASGEFTSVTGGSGNNATGPASSVSGGIANTASGEYASVSGGQSNSASGSDASVSGGTGNAATSASTSVSGGVENTASGSDASVSGGLANTARGLATSVAGGESRTASLNFNTQVGPTGFGP
jgi:hypothetical protein